MNSGEVLKDSFFETLYSSLNGDTRGARSFVENLHSSAELIAPPATDSPSENMTYTLLTYGRPDVPISVRREHAKIALHQTRDTILAQLANLQLINLDTVKSHADSLSSRFISDTLALATNYPKTSDTSESQRVMFDLLNPKKESFEDAITSVSVLYDFFEPYLLDRLVDLNVFDEKILGEQLTTIKEDMQLLVGFSKSVGPVIQLLSDGKTDHTTQELANNLYGIGPIFAKMVQSFADVVPTSSPGVRRIAQQLQAAFQDGVAPPSARELDMMQQDLPAGLTFKGAISSASVAYVISTQNGSETDLATKVPRPGIEDAVARNIRLFQLIYGILLSYTREHVGEGDYVNNLATIERVLPFFMKIAQTSITHETDMSQEAQAQKRARIIFERHKSIIIPQIIDAYSDDKHITMDRVDAKRFETLPANQAYLQNLFIFSLELWKSRFWHSNPHGGNIKGREDGTIVVYNWGQNLDIPADFVPNLRNYLYALARKNPTALASAYAKIQSSEHYQATEAEIESLAREVFASRRKTSAGGLKGFMQDFMDTQKTMTLSLALRYQSSMDPRYLYFMSSAIELLTLFNAELTKPEYKSSWRKYRVIAQSIIKAVREVYIRRDAGHSYFNN